MNSQDIRNRFLHYFAKQQHTIVPGSSLIPGNDPTLLFTNAGMVQFKDVFLGADPRSYTRAVTSQPCLRAGGKHNDLENVGYTARHHTFFEMLGNFSFGEYFKRDAIHMAWCFLTEELKLPKERLWVTVFEEDDEAAAIWLTDIGVDPQRLSRIGAKDNFWSMGDTGPCGPCSEIFYDHGADVWGGPPGTPEEDGDRYIEIWNLVFMQYNRALDGTLTPLPKPSVDTGMGLERLAAVLQNKHNNYDTDVFQPLIKAAADLADLNDLTQQSLRVVADHLRATVFLITDGVRPSNEGRGYVLRRIMRRALRHGHQLGLPDLFFHQLVPHLVTLMGEAYPQLIAKQAHVQQVMVQEEEQFARTLAQGLKLLEEAIASLAGAKTIPGDTVFKLYDTYGFPVDLTADIAREKGLSLDQAGFEQAMAKQRHLSKSASKFNQAATGLTTTCGSEFVGYDQLSIDTAIVELYQGSNRVTQLSEGQEGSVVLPRSPFYAESGGQVGDSGWLRTQTAEFEVLDTQKAGDGIVHHGRLLRGTLQEQDVVSACVNTDLRRATALNHSATHLLHKALQLVLGEHVEQKGSLVNSQRLRFDFTHGAAMTPEQIQAVETIVNQQIRDNLPVKTELMSPEAAMQAGAMALFGEKYGSTVRVLSMGDFSKELCGGTHATRTGDIGLFKCVSEAGISAGVRRIEAVSGEAAWQWLLQLQDQWHGVASKLKVTPKQVPDRLDQVLLNEKQQQKAFDKLQQQWVALQAESLLAQVDMVHGVKTLVVALPGIDASLLKALGESLTDRLAVSVVVLLGVNTDRVSVIGMSRVSVCHAGQLVSAVAAVLGGKGGGRAEFAQASGSDVNAVTRAIHVAKAYLTDAPLA